MEQQTSGELVEILRNFDYTVQSKLPKKLLEAVKGGIEIIVEGKYGLNMTQDLVPYGIMIELQKEFGEVGDVPILYVWEKGNVFYHPTNGIRLGDKQGVNNWFLKG